VALYRNSFPTAQGRGITCHSQRVLPGIFVCLTFSVLTVGRRLVIRLFEDRDAGNSVENGTRFHGWWPQRRSFPAPWGVRIFGHLYAYGFGFFLFTLAYASRRGGAMQFLVSIALAIGILGLLYTIAYGNNCCRCNAKWASPKKCRCLGRPLCASFIMRSFQPMPGRCASEARSRPHPVRGKADMIATRFPNIYDPFALMSVSPRISTGYYLGMHDVMNLHSFGRKNLGASIPSVLLDPC